VPGGGPAACKGKPAVGPRHRNGLAVPPTLLAIADEVIE
jgi:hypothetical protein